MAPIVAALLDPGRAAGLGEMLRISRRLNRLSQEEAAAKAGIHKVTLSNYERGLRTPAIDVLERLAGVYGTTSENLLSNTIVTPAWETSDPEVFKSCPVSYRISETAENLKVVVSSDELIQEGIRAWDMVYLDEKADLEVGKLYLVKDNGQLSFRYLCVSEDGQVLLRSVKDEYEPIPVKSNRLEILGRVVGYFHPM